MEISPERAPTSVPAPAVGDHLALDFLNSIAAPHGQWLEWIGDGSAYLVWLEGAGAIQPAERKEALRTFSQKQLDDLAAEARELREWFRSLLPRVKDGGTRVVGQKDIDKLNRALGASMQSRHLKRDKERRLQLIWKPQSAGAHRFLANVAEAIAELLCEEDLNLVARCQGTGCSIWFYDRTKSHHRRFCSQAICGNRARVTAFRKRSRDGA